MRTWLVWGGAGCVIGVILVGAVRYKTKPYLKEIQSQTFITEVRLKDTNQRFPFTPPGSVEYAGGAFDKFLNVRRAWTQSVLQHVPVNGLRALQESEREGDFQAALSVAEGFATGLGRIGLLLADTLVESEMSYAEYRWHTGNLLAVLAADPPASEELGGLYSRMAEEVRYFPITGRLDNKLTAAELREEFGFWLDPADSRDMDNLTEKLGLIHKPESFILLLDLYALTGKLAFTDPSASPIQVDREPATR